MVDRITDMPMASFIEDGSIVEVEFKTEKGNTIALRFATNDFDRFVGRAAQLIAGARHQTLSIGDHLEIHPVPAVAAMAQAPEGGGRVILSVRSDTGLPYHFSLSPEEAERLRP